MPGAADQNENPHDYGTDAWSAWNQGWTEQLAEATK